MSQRYWCFAIAACLVLASGCRNAGPRLVIDPAMASCVPAGTTVLAGADLVRLRASPLYPKLPGAVGALLDPLRDADSLMIASDGKNLLTIARGRFAQPPAGGVLLAKDLVIGGTPDFVAAATAQYKSGRSGSPGLIDYAASIAPGTQIWILAPGGVALPLTGNAANLNRLLRDSEYASVTVKLDSGVELAFGAIGRTAEAARQVEDTLRAAITLAIAGESRQPEMASLLRSIQLSREDRKVSARLAANAESAGRLLGALAP